MSRRLSVETILRLTLAVLGSTVFSMAGCAPPTRASTTKELYALDLESRCLRALTAAIAVVSVEQVALRARLRRQFLCSPSVEA